MYKIKGGVVPGQPGQPQDGPNIEPHNEPFEDALDEPYDDTLDFDIPDNASASEGALANDERDDRAST